MIISSIVVVSLLIAVPLMFLWNEGNHKDITVDGSFNDWDNVITYKDSETDQSNPDVNLVEYKMNKDDLYLSFYLKVKGEILRGSETNLDIIRIFIDTDQNVETGYQIKNVGADYRIEISGYENTILSNGYYEFDTDRANNDWNGWNLMFYIDAECHNNELEAQIWNDDLNLNNDDVTAIFQIVDTEGNEDYSDYAISLEGSALLVEQKSTAKSVITKEIEMLQLKLTANGADIVINGIELKEEGNIESDIEETFPITILKDETKVLSVKVNPSKAKTGSVAGVNVKSVDVEESSSVTITGRAARAYVKDIPNGIVIDGLFEEWKQFESHKDKKDDVSNPNVDITDYNSISDDKIASFYLKVDGEIMAGAAIPEGGRAVPTTNPEEDSEDKETKVTTGTQKETPLPVVTGEDSAIIFLDTDVNLKTGYQVNNKMGADYMIKIKGKYGDTSTEYYKFINDKWEKDSSVKPVTANDEKQLECQIPIDNIQMLKGVNIYFHLIDWEGIEDYSDGPIDIQDIKLLIGEGKYVGQGDEGWTSAYWRFNEESGTSAADSGGQNPTHTATLFGNAHFNEYGKFGYALGLDGDRDYAYTADEDKLDLTVYWSIEAWVNLEDATNEQYVVSKTDNTDDGFKMGVKSEALFCEVWNTDGTKYTFNTGTLYDDTWAHIALTYNRNDVMQGFVNGLLVSSQSVADFDTQQNSETLHIGIANYDPGLDEYEVWGWIDDLRIYRRAKTAFGGGVVIDEVGFPGSGNNYIKLYNNAGSTVNIEGWKFENQDGDLLTISGDQNIAAGGTLTLTESSYSNLGNLDSTDWLEAYDLDPDNDGDNDNSANYQAMVDFVSWGDNAGTGDANAVDAGLWTDNTYVVVAGGMNAVQLIITGNNDEAQSDWEDIPEFQTTIIPIIGMVAIFIVFRRKKRIRK